MTSRNSAVTQIKTAPAIAAAPPDMASMRIEALEAATANAATPRRLTVRPACATRHPITNAKKNVPVAATPMHPHI